MYQVSNPQEIHVFWNDGFRGDRPCTAILKDEKELIKFLAEGYVNSYLYDWLGIRFWDINHNKRFDYVYIDGYDRAIEVRTYKHEAWDYYQKILKHQDRPDKYIWWKNKTYKGEFRREPVEGIHKPKGWAHERGRGPRMKQIVAMYKNPEYKEFNRGDKVEFPWWDDIYRSPQKNWKEQRKVRHQWER